MSDNIAAARADLAPSGTLHAGINFSNILLIARTSSANGWAWQSR